MNIVNAKTCPRCQSVVPAERGVCPHCGRLFRTPLAQNFDPNRTMMFYDGSLPAMAPPPAPPLPRILRMRRWLQRLRTRLQSLIGRMA